MPSNHLILYCPLLPPPSIFPSFRVLSKESVFCIRRPKYLSFSFSISLSNEYSVLVSSRIDWLDLLAVQGTLKNLLQHHSPKASVVPCSAFFIVQLSHPYLNTGKTIALSRWTFVRKVMSLLFNMLSRLIIAFLPRSKCLSISWMQSPYAMIWGPPKIKSLFPYLFAMKWRDRITSEMPILWPPDVKNWLIWKDPDAGKDWGWEEKGTTENEMVGWHHQLDGHEC